MNCFAHIPAKKPLIINAFRGLGDIIFAIPIYREFIKQGHTVIHPFMNLYGPIWKHWPEIAWLEKEMLNIPYDNSGYTDAPNYKIEPIRFSDSRMRVTYDKVMRAKYDMYGMDFTKWREVTWERHPEDEAALAKILNINPGDKYIIVNTRFRHDRTGNVSINLNLTELEVKGIRIIEMYDVPGYTLLDWHAILENAVEIHSVGTSICYMLDAEFFNLKCPVHYYVRRPDEHDFRFYDYLLKRDYVWHNDF